MTTRLDLMDASNKGIQVVIKKESEILATAWNPASIEAQARAEINEDTIDVSVEGKNNGWHAPHLTVRTLVFRQDGVRHPSLDDRKPGNLAGDRRCSQE